MKTHVSMRERVVPKVVKKWLYKIILQQKNIVLKRHRDDKYNSTMIKITEASKP